MVCNIQTVYSCVHIHISVKKHDWHELNTYLLDISKWYERNFMLIMYWYLILGKLKLCYQCWEYITCPICLLLFLNCNMGVFTYIVFWIGANSPSLDIITLGWIELMFVPVCFYTGSNHGICEQSHHNEINESSRWAECTKFCNDYA